MSDVVALVVDVCFWSAFVIDIFILIYALVLSKRMGGSGALQKTTLFAGLSAFVFGIHHIMEIFLAGNANGIAIAEGVEGVAAILLGVAVYYLYKLTVVE
jgi:hypothetical protein